jgi:hypothetical protein
MRPLLKSGERPLRSRSGAGARDDITQSGMLRTLVRHAPSPAMVVACLALTVALSGAGYAALRLPANSVGTNQLKRHAVTGVKVRRDTLTGTHVRESTLAKVRTAARADTAGTADNAATAGSAPVARLDYRQSAPVIIPADPFVHVRQSVSCDAGSNAIGGGAKVSDPNRAFIVDVNPVGKTGWEATASAEYGSFTSLTVYVICAQAASTTP